MKVYYNNVIQAQVQKIFFEKIAKIFFSIAKHPRRDEVSLALVGNKEIQKINYQYRGINSPTDVLSFSEKEHGMNLPFNTKALGEIIISYPKAKKQAKEQAHPIETELCTLFVHGLAHLMGYGHNTHRERKRMDKLEMAVLGAIKKQEVRIKN